MRALHDLCLNDLTTEDVEPICSSEFTEEPDFILNFTDSTNTSITQFIQTVKSVGRKKNVWELLKGDKITCSHVQVWVFYILNGLTAAANYAEKRRAMLATQLYIVLLQQPGSGGGQLYHPIIYEKMLSSMKMATEVDTCVAKSKSKKKTSDRRPDDMQEKETVLTTQQAVSLFELLTSVLKDFCEMLLVVSLKNRFLSLKQSIEVFVHIIKSTNVQASSISESSSDIFLPIQLALRGLKSIISPKHGDIDKLSLLVFRLLMTTITMRHAVVASSGKNLPRRVFQQSEAVMDLVSAVYREHGDKVAHSARALMQNVIAQCPERIEAKNHVSSLVFKFVYNMPLLWYADFIGWLVRFACHQKISYRVGALSVMGRLLVCSERPCPENISLNEEQACHLKHKILLQSVLTAITDVAPTVRAKALQVLADVMDKGTVFAVVFSDVLQNQPMSQSPNKENVPLHLPDATPSEGNIEKSYPAVTPAVLNSLPVPSLCEFPSAGSSLLSIISPRVTELKFVVRKSAVLALEVALCNGYILATKGSLDILSERCRDPLLSVRKLAIQSITKVLTIYPDNGKLQKTWVKSLFPSIMDAETSMQEKAQQLIENKLLQNIGNEAYNGWDILNFLVTEEGDPFRGYLQKVAKEWQNQQKLGPNVLKEISTYLKDKDRKESAWMLLKIFTLFTGDRKIANCVFYHWQVESEMNVSLCMKIDMINTMGQSAKYLSEEEKQILLSKLKKQVETHQCEIQLIGPTFEAIQKIIHSQQNDRMSAKAVSDEWHAQLLNDSDNFFSDIIMTSPQHNFNDSLVINHLYMVGEASQRSNEKVPKRLLLSIQALLTTEGQRPEETGSQPLSQPWSQFHSTKISPAIRAHTIFNLGRICFRNDNLAKKCIPAMARELEMCEYEEVRNNVLVVLTDLCVLQTQLVDQHFSAMATCLGDKSQMIRKHAVILISSLLQKEYVKWKGTLLFKYLHAACDEDLEVQSLARYFLLEQLLRGPSVAGDLFYRNFVACLFYYNAYEHHNLHKFAKSDREKKLFDVSQNFDKRMNLYQFLLINMADEHRINLTGKLCNDVLDAFVEGVIPLNKNSQQLLTDTLSVLCCKEIRLKCLRAREVEADIEEEILPSTQVEQVNAMKQAAKQKLISQVVKKNLVENIVPIIIALKNMLAEKKSPLLKNVMLYLKEVMQEYRTEVQQILSEDKQLASEIEFDLKRFDREEEEAKEAVRRRQSLAAPMSAPGTPAGARPLPQKTPAAGATPATINRRNLPMNVQAIINSARKNQVLRRPLIVEELSTLAEAAPTPKTPRQNLAADRVASTPDQSHLANVTFADDISAIVAPSQADPHLVLIQHPESTPPPRTWNITSPSPATRRSGRLRKKT
ncbi:condensin-2 complex subunit D3-L-like [Clavelina lepadiformis]|uniref:condensin-2 complex subunit D3-L-like n=1 Tax=Clavelina lepadiformis TaxID=159417 RepID=UPI004042C237